MAKLSNKRQAFVDEYLIDLNATGAAERAGYSDPNYGRQLLTDPNVKAEIERRQANRSKRVQIEADDVVRQLARMGISDPRRLFHADGTTKGPHELDDDIAMAIQSVESTTYTDEDGNSRTTYKYRLADRVKPLELIGRHLGKALGQWSDRTEHDVASDSPLASLVQAINGSKSATLQPEDDNA